MKILLGSQTGERASTEDGKEWSATIMARRENYVIPNIERVIQKFEDFGILPDGDWQVVWTDLTESSSSEKAEKAKNMSEVNKNMLGTGMVAFDVDEIRVAMGFDAREESEGDDGLIDDLDIEDEETEA
jgi:hypothetical protein